jgi:dihydroorotate dehydrogenase
MSWFYRALMRPALFAQDAEQAHTRALKTLAWISRRELACDALESFFAPDELPVEVLGLRFPNPLGLAAGMDKNAEAAPAWAALGFGFSELGGVTWHAQPGNAPPRLFRAIAEEAIVNRMGFNNDGVDRIAARIPATRLIPVGVNVGMNRDVELRDAAGNYAEAIQKCPANFYVLNVSSPNTPGLRKLQEREFLDDLLSVVGRLCESAPPVAASQKRPTTPVLLKLSPDLTFEQLDDALDLAQQHAIAGIVATNTTATPEGGLSGAPLRARATECIRHIRRQSKLPIIGVGGIFTAADAYEKIRAGASLVEVWTGMVYEGPAIVRNINRGLLRLLERDGFGSMVEAVGTE